MSTDRIRVALVDDSDPFRGRIEGLLRKEADVEVVCSVSNGSQAIEAARQSPIDVMVLDIEMPVMDGLTALPRILDAQPSLAVVMASTLTQHGANLSLRALFNGALDYLPKPSNFGACPVSGEFSSTLLAKIRSLGRRQHRHRPSNRPEPSISPSCRSVGSRPQGKVPRLIVVGASTGGPEALATFLSGLGSDFRLPILLVQHMPMIFTRLLAERFQALVGRPCREATDGEPLRDGTTYVAPGDFHMRLAPSENGPTLKLDRGDMVSYCRPSLDATLHSVVAVVGGAAMGVVLTGMGCDGCDGAGALTGAGGSVYVQDEATSVVWGMPGAVVQAGHASAVLPIESLGPTVAKVVADARNALV